MCKRVAYKKMKKKKYNYVLQVKKNLLENTSVGKEITNASDETHLRYGELITVRQILRLDDYLLNASTNQEHKSNDGTIILNEALINFTALAEEYRTNYKQSFVKDKDEAIPTKVIM